MIVDVHCHMFNADDLPVGGFVSHRRGLDWFGGRAVARLVDRYIQKRAPGYADDADRMRRLLADDGFEAAEVIDPAGDLSRDEESVLDELAADPELLAEIAAEAGDADADGGAEALSVDDVRRVVAWASLFGQSRLSLPALYHASTGRQVRLAVPLLVDLESGVEDRAVTSRQEQIELFDLLSRISMRGQLPDAPDLRLHPFVAFDPLRELAHRAAPRGASPLEVAQNAVTDHGFIGVKVYPPMGWRPSGNTDPGLDEVVLDLARWCADNDVPITAHGNASNEADPAYAGFGSPVEWARVLAACPELRLNLGHFGGAHESPGKYHWAREIAAMMDRFEHLYADVSCHRVDRGRTLGTVLAVVRELHTAGHPVLARVMFGTDWYMQAANPEPDRFLDTYRAAWQRTFPDDDATAAFMGGNALRFLGLSEPSANAARLRRRYGDEDLDRPEWLA